MLPPKVTPPAFDREQLPQQTKERLVTVEKCLTFSNPLFKLKKNNYHAQDLDFDLDLDSTHP